MNANAVVVEGVVKPDGSLEVPHKINLPAGPVQVTVESVSQVPQPERFWKMMETIWAKLRGDGRTMPTVDEIDSQIECLRKDAEREMQSVEQLQKPTAHLSAQPDVPPKS